MDFYTALISLAYHAHILRLQPEKLQASYEYILSDHMMVRMDHESQKKLLTTIDVNITDKNACHVLKLLL